MDARLIALKLSLDELHIPFDVTTKDCRIVIQKAVYLGQFVGPDMGYRFVWDQNGPYSGDLALDYHSLADDLLIGDDEFERMELHSNYKERLRGILDVMTPPDNCELSKVLWLELIASMHYLRKVVGLDRESVKERISNDKAHIVAFADSAESALLANPLLAY